MVCISGNIQDMIISYDPHLIIFLDHYPYNIYNLVVSINVRSSRLFIKYWYL